MLKRVDLLLAALAALVLTVGVGYHALAQNDPQKKDPPKPAEKKGVHVDVDVDLEQLLKDLPGVDAENLKKFLEMRQQFPGGGFNFGPRFAMRGEGRLGVMATKPSETLVEQLDLPKDRGLVIEDVVADSAAAKAGLKAHDILLELDGKPVSQDVREFKKYVDEIKADTPVDVVVLRKGKKETIKGLKLPEAKAAAAPALPNFPNPPRPPRLPALPGGPNVKSDSISITRNNDRFVTEQRKGGVTIKVTGKVADGKAEVSEVKVDDGKGQVKTYESLDKVPEAHREQAKKLAEMSAAGRVRFTQP
jgi:membrane-associated protease RseP (regulator of RpoE activity)